MDGRPTSAPLAAPTRARRPFGPWAAVAVAIVMLGVVGLGWSSHALGAVASSPAWVGGPTFRADTTNVLGGTPGSLTPAAVISLPTTQVPETLSHEHEDPYAPVAAKQSGPIGAVAPSGSVSYSTPNGWDGIYGAESACFQPVVGMTGSPLACLPPDVTMSASPSYVVEENNVAGEIWSTGGTEKAFFTLTNFYTAPSGAGCYLSDPEVYYDAGTGHWFTSILSVTGCTGAALKSSIYLAVSVTNDPTGSWYEYVIPNAVTGDLSDQPVMGVNNNVVVLSTNEFPYPALVANFYDGALFYVLNKAQLEQNGCTAPIVQGCTNPVAYNWYGPYSAMASIHPAHSYGNAPVEYMASANAYAYQQGGTNTLNFVAVSGAPGTVGGVTVTETNLGIAPTTGPPPGTEPGTTSGYGGFTVNTDDSRISTGVYQNGVSWWGATDGCTVAGVLHDCLRLIEVTTSKGYKVAQDFDYTTSTSAGVQDDFYPGITLSASGILSTTFAYSSISAYPSMAVTVQGKAGSLEPAKTVAVGLDNEQGGRYGDYCDGSPSYTSSTGVWFACEYIKSYSADVWDTHIEAVNA